MDSSLARKMVSRRPAGPADQEKHLIGWTVFTAGALLITFLIFPVLSPRLKTIHKPASAAASPLADKPEILTKSTGPQTEPQPSEKQQTLHDKLTGRPSSSSFPDSSLTAPFNIEHSSQGSNQSWIIQTSPDPAQAGSLANETEISSPSMDFLPVDTSGEQYFWNGTSRSILYHLDAGRLAITLLMDQTPTRPTQTGLVEHTGQLNFQIRPERGSPAPMDQKSVYLPMRQNFHSQLYETSLPNACGPAAALIVLDYFELETSLSPVIEQMRAIPPENGGYDPACSRNPVCTSPTAIAHVFAENYNLIAHTRPDWSLEDLHLALQRGNPVIADIRWFEGGTLGHFVVIYGVDIENSTLTYHDPFFGADRSTSWENFSARWSGPVDLGDPLQPEGFRFWGMEVYPPPS